MLRLFLISANLALALLNIIVLSGGDVENPGGSAIAILICAFAAGQLTSNYAWIRGTNR